jgi:hypothetical protein
MMPTGSSSSTCVRTSGANYADVYLMSSAADLASGVNGYFVRIGGTNDRLELFRSDAGHSNEVWVQSQHGVVNSSTANPFRIKVTRSIAGLWTLDYDDGAYGYLHECGQRPDAHVHQRHVSSASASSRARRRRR